jgi:transposase-like protein
VAGNGRKFSPEFKEKTAKMVVETSRSIAHVAGELNVNETTLGSWYVPRM